MPSTKGTALRTTARYAGLLLVVVAGVFLGFFISVKSGLTEKLSGGWTEPSHMPNGTIIHTGDTFPPDIPGVEMAEFNGLDTLLAGKETIIAFVSTGCNTCEMFLNFLANTKGVQSGKYKVQLYSADPEQFTKKFNFPCSHLTGETEVALAVRVYPTIIGVDESGTVRFVSAGFGREIDEKFFEKNL